MASQSSPSTVSVVGHKFVLKYYTRLNNSPQTLFHFYKERSSFTHGYEGDLQSEETVVGLENINRKIQSLNFQDSFVSLSVVDCQESQDGGILIMVLGSLTGIGQQTKKFAQTFFLAVQTEPAGYYVLNDIFRFLKDTESGNVPSAGPSSVTPSVISTQPTNTVTTPTPEQKVTPAPVVSTPIPTPTTTSAPTVTSSQTPAEASATTEKKEKVQQVVSTPTPNTTAPSTVPSSSTPNHVQHEEKNENKVNNTSAPQAVVQPTKEQEKSTPSGSNSTSSTQSPPQKQQTTKPSPAKQAQPPAKTEPGPPSSWAALVTHLATGTESEGKFQPPPTKVATTATANTKPSELEKEKKESPKPTNVTKEKEKEKEKDKEKSSKSKFALGKPIMKEGCSIYISNIPFSTTEDQIRSTFKQFGTIKTVVLRAQKGYSFVEYPTPEIVQQAVQTIKANPITLDGRQVTVEERKMKDPRPEKSNKKSGSGRSGKKAPTQVDEKETTNGTKNGDTTPDAETWQKFPSHSQRKSNHHKN